MEKIKYGKTINKDELYNLKEVAILKELGFLETARILLYNKIYWILKPYVA